MQPTFNLELMKNTTWYTRTTPINNTIPYQWYGSSVLTIWWHVKHSRNKILRFLCLGLCACIFIIYEMSMQPTFNPESIRNTSCYTRTTPRIKIQSLKPMVWVRLLMIWWHIKALPNKMETSAHHSWLFEVQTSESVDAIYLTSK